ncbi:MAG TPA: YHS domain-containing protein [Dehalococcoidia bacterium]|nr:YHS domain-containing protein [Dehalococcoidia bacterium]
MRASLEERGVCEVEVDGETYYFCGPGCNRAFQKEPEAYLSGDKKIEM